MSESWEDFEPAETAGRYEPDTPTGKLGCLAMVVFWLVLLLLWPTRWITPGYLVISMVILKLLAWAKGWTFRSLVTNNDWVCPATFAMFVITTFMACLNRLVPGGWFGALFEGKLVDSAFWATVNNMLFDESFTNGWRYATLIFFVAFIISVAVSYTDEMVDRGKKILATATKEGAKGDHGHGLGSIFRHEIIGELMLLPFKIIGKKWLGIGH